MGGRFWWRLSAAKILKAGLGGAPHLKRALVKIGSNRSHHAPSSRPEPQETEGADAKRRRPTAHAHYHFARFQRVRARTVFGLRSVTPNERADVMRLPR